MIEIPITDYPDFSEDIELDGVPFRFAFIYNSRGDYWTMTVADSNGNIIVAGLKVVIDYELIKSYGLFRTVLPAGLIFPVDPSEKTLRVGRDDLPTNVKVVYVPEDEI